MMEQENDKALVIRPELGPLSTIETLIKGTVKSKTTIDDVDHILETCINDKRFQEAKSRVLAFRISSIDKSINVIEGYDDDGEEGAGEKLIFLLRKLAFENILLIICLWHPKLPGCFGPAIYRYIIDEAKELLKTWFQKELKEEEEKSVMRTTHDRKRLKTAHIDGTVVGSEISIPSQFEGVFATQQVRKERLDFRPNMFKPTKGTLNNNSILLNAIPQAIMSESESYQVAARAEECINSISKSDIISLKERRQDDIIQKVLQLLCILKGKAPTWQNVRELLSPLTFKLEFSMTDVTKLRAENIFRAHEWLIMYQNLFNTADLEKLHPAAARLLEWANNILILYKYRYSKAIKPISEPQGLPKMRRTAGEAAGLRLTGTKKQFEYGQRTETRKVQTEGEYYVKPQKVVATKKRPNKGRCVTGKVFALSGAAQVSQGEVPLAVLRGVGKQKAIIMKPTEDKRRKTNKSESTGKDSGRLGTLLDKFAEPKDV